MTAQIIDGKAIAANVKVWLKQQISQLKQQHQKVPHLACVLVGENADSASYVRSKLKTANELGMEVTDLHLPAEISQDQLLQKIQQLNLDQNINGILVQLPLPKHIDENLIIETINPAKDVDGLHPQNLGKLFANQDGIKSCTPLGCMILIDSVLSDLSGKNALVIGRSTLVGKPMAAMLLNADCSVQIAHSKTKNLAALCQQADIIIAAAGAPQLVKADWIKAEAVLIDVGLTWDQTAKQGKGGLVGDIDFASVSEKAAAITPVPGGVGPMTIAGLMLNSFEATCRQNNLPVVVYR